VVKDENGKVMALHCTYLADSKSGNDTSGVQVKGTIHWANAATALPAQVRLYDRLFTVENPSAEEGDFKEFINPLSLQTIQTAYVEPSLQQALPGATFQFIRKGYFCTDIESTAHQLIFNRTVTLKDAWVKEASKN
jgi:glutaminyl-tRNA synthetase